MAFFGYVGVLADYLFIFEYSVSSISILVTGTKKCFFGFDGLIKGVVIFFYSEFKKSSNILP